MALLVPKGYPFTLAAGTEATGKDIDPTTVTVNPAGVVSGGQTVAPNGTKDTPANLAVKAAAAGTIGRFGFLRK